MLRHSLLYDETIQKLCGCFMRVAHNVGDYRRDDCLAGLVTQMWLGKPAQLG